MSIKAVDLNYVYGNGTAFEQHALFDVNFEIQDGEFVGIIGHTGSGKSTLIQHLNGLIKASSGALYYNGENIYKDKYDMKKLRSKVGLVFQYPEHQLFEIDVLTDVCFGPKNQGLSEEEAKEKAKKALGLVDFLKLKEQKWARLQHMAEQAGLSDVLKEIPIVRVNAKSAFRGKTENKQVLLEKSGFLEFEKRLTEFLQQISSDEIYGRLKTSLLAFLSGSLNVLEMRSQANLVKKYDDLLKNMEGNKGKVRRAVRQEIHNERASIHGKIQGKLRSAIFNSNEQTFNSDDFENYIQNTFECSAQRVTDVLESEVGLLIQQLQLDIEILQAEILKANIPSGINTINIQDIQGETQSLDISALNQQHISQISPEAVTKAIGELAELAKPEHIVAGLKIVKTYLPSLMKGIGTKTMEKWATAIAQKIPYAGTLIQVGLALYEIFSGDKQANQMQDAINEQNRQRERAMQQIDDSANEVASQFENAMREQTGKIIDEVFANVTQQIHALRQGFSDDERQNSEWLEQLSSYQVLAQSA